MQRRLRESLVSIGKCSIQMNRKRGEQMERFYSPAQVAEIMSISKRQAYNIMYQMPYIPSPLRVSERALKDWIERHTVYPVQRRKTA